MTSIFTNIHYLCADDAQWIFSGIGTQGIVYLISIILGSCGVGFVGGYWIRGIHIKNKQTQKAGDNATQTMTGSTTNITTPNVNGGK